MLIIFQNFPEQFGLSSVIDFLFGTINILEKDSALNDCSLQYGYAPCDEFNGMKEGGGDQKYKYLETFGILRKFTVYFDPDGIYTRSEQINSLKKT